MTKPLVNLNAIEIGEDGYAVVSDPLGARRLGYNVSALAPGASGAPYHNHHVNEEMFLILAGEGELRFGERTFPVRPLDIIACPPGGREVAHALTNTGNTELRYLALSTRDPHDVCEFPDTDQVGVYVGTYGAMKLRHWFRVDQASGPPWESA